MDEYKCRLRAWEKNGVQGSKRCRVGTYVRYAAEAAIYS